MKSFELTGTDLHADYPAQGWPTTPAIATLSLIAAKAPIVPIPTGSMKGRAGPA